MNRRRFLFGLASLPVIGSLFPLAWGEKPNGTIFFEEWSTSGNATKLHIKVEIRGEAPISYALGAYDITDEQRGIIVWSSALTLLHKYADISTEIESEVYDKWAELSSQMAMVEEAKRAFAA